MNLIIEFIESGSSILGWIPIRIRIRIQGFDDKKLKKIYSLNKKFDQKLQFTYAQAGRLGEAFSPQKRNPALQIMKFINFFHFCGSFLPSQIRIRIPDPLTWLIHFGSGSETLVKYMLNRYCNNLDIFCLYTVPMKLKSSQFLTKVQFQTGLRRTAHFYKLTE